MPDTTALLLVSFGGPERPEDVLPFLRNVTRGRDVPESRLQQVAEHYHALGGRSPINDQNRALLERLRPALVAAGIAAPVYWGNRNWDPMLDDVLREIANDGHGRVIAVATSAWSSYSGCRQYREDLARAAASLSSPTEILKIRPFHDHPGFIDAQADRIREALASRPLGDTPRLVFVAHSIPLAMAAASRYVDQVTAASGGVVGRLDRSVEWDLAWCSRSGPASAPWLEPDVNDHLRALAKTGIEDVLLVPIGFVSDHMEVAWDLDVEAASTAAGLGMRLARAGSVGTHPAFVGAIVDLFASALRATPGPTANEALCAADCCRVPGMPDLAVVAAP